MVQKLIKKASKLQVFLKNSKSCVAAESHHLSQHAAQLRLFSSKVV